TGPGPSPRFFEGGCYTTSIATILLALMMTSLSSSFKNDSQGAWAQSDNLSLQPSKNENSYMSPFIIVTLICFLLFNPISPSLPEASPFLATAPAPRAAPHDTPGTH